MRIISGQFGGRQIHAPASLPVRPTTDYAKTGLFNILNNHVDFADVSVLDLFCGTGNITYEFLSRGCKAITAVDADRRCVRFVKETLARLGADGAQVIQSDVFRYLASPKKSYDIIFADPPFDNPDTSRLPGMIREGGWLKEGGWLIIEHAAKTRLDSDWKPKDVRVYGNCAFSIYW